jgi:SAM-dependent methyltransferase
MLSGLEYQAERLNNFLWETRLGIATRGRVESARSDSLECQSTAYSGVNRVLRHLSLQPSDVFVDIGCGKGRVVCCAAQYPCKRVVGVEYLAEVCREAQANAERMRGRKAPISIHTGPAEEFDYSEATVLYLCKPFGPTTFDAVLRKVQHETRGHSVRLAFVNPSPDHMAVLAAQGWEQTDYWDVVKGRGFSVSFCRRQEG